MNITKRIAEKAAALIGKSDAGVQPLVPIPGGPAPDATTPVQIAEAREAEAEAKLEAARGPLEAARIAHAAALHVAVGGDPTESRRTRKAVQDAQANHDAIGEVLEAARQRVEKARAVMARDEAARNAKLVQQLAAERYEDASEMDRLICELGNRYRAWLEKTDRMRVAIPPKNHALEAAVSWRGFAHRFKELLQIHGMPGGTYALAGKNSVKPFAEMTRDANAPILQATLK